MFGIADVAKDRQVNIQSENSVRNAEIKFETTWPVPTADYDSLPYYLIWKVTRPEVGGV